MLPCACRVGHLNAVVELVGVRTRKALNARVKGLYFIQRQEGDSRVTQTEVYFRQMNLAAILRCTGIRKLW